ncbi:hypothetical protein PHMEG_00020654 [Phytophthora megakarya]|uniref:Uncharacterized protein n=1 Tax=Phytophthora megakarya TaxID=4795 RepID=A0A225VR49_9STRA|nr:hypothetical protein PHMEG_00020654 [Phytophthora megakarya]
MYAGRQVRRAPGRPEHKIPTDAIACIPTRDGKEVCLHYLSVGGCNSEEPEKCMCQNRTHFTPTSIPPKLRHYQKVKASESYEEPTARTKYSIAPVRPARAVFG